MSSQMFIWLLQFRLLSDFVLIRHRHLRRSKSDEVSLQLWTDAGVRLTERVVFQYEVLVWCYKLWEVISSYWVQVCILYSSPALYTVFWRCQGRSFTLSPWRLVLDVSGVGLVSVCDGLWVVGGGASPREAVIVSVSDLSSSHPHRHTHQADHCPPCPAGVLPRHRYHQNHSPHSPLSPWWGVGWVGPQPCYV